MKPGASWLLAEGLSSNEELVRAIRDELNSPNELRETLYLLAAVAVFAAIMRALWRFMTRRERAQQTKRDYLTIAVDLLGLNERTRRDLQRVASESGLQHPLVMLLSPLNLARATRAATQRRPDAQLEASMQRLSLALFDTPLPPAGAAPPEGEPVRDREA